MVIVEKEFKEIEEFLKIEDLSAYIERLCPKSTVIEVSVTDQKDNFVGHLKVNGPKIDMELTCESNHLKGLVNCLKEKFDESFNLQKEQIP